ncbi:MAG: hypothetical protein U1E56_11605 [Bauldia sp.]
MIPFAVFGTVAAYVMVAVLLLSLNLTSLWRWWIKAAAMVVTTAFFVGTYLAIDGILGWPSAAALPDRFKFLSSQVMEPNKVNGDPGAIFLWIQELDDKNLPVSVPKNFRLNYTVSTAKDVQDAQSKRQAGKDVMGKTSDKKGKEGEENEPPKKLGPVLETEAVGTTTDTVPFMDDTVHMTFEELPPILLPDKIPLTADAIH